MADVHQADRRQQGQRQADAQAPTAPGVLAARVVLVVLVDPHGDDQRQRPDDQGNGYEEPPPAEHGGSAVIDRPPERSGEIGVDAERGDDAGDAQQDGEGVGPVVPELFVEVVTPGGPDRHPGPAPRTLLRGTPP